LREFAEIAELFTTDFAKIRSTCYSACWFPGAFAVQRPKQPAAPSAEYGRCFYCSSAGQEIDAEIDEKIVAELSYQATGKLSPIVAVIGGFVAQEVLKHYPAKFHPSSNTYTLTLSNHSLDSSYRARMSTDRTRYDGQTAIFGKAFQDKIATHRQFLVVRALIGCEMLEELDA